MNIQPLNTYNSQTFTSSGRRVYNGLSGRVKALFRINDNDILHRNTTFFYRNDLDWDNFSKFLLDKYKNTSKVNTYCYACSDGSEPYSLIMDLKTKAPNQADKFFPVVAKDYDSEIIRQAKSGTIYVDNYGKYCIEERTDKNFDRFFGDDVICDKRNDYYGKVFEVKPELSNNVIFELADICEDVKNIKPDNSIVLCRNFWPYLKSQEKMDTLAQNLYDRLGHNSIVILGKYDRDKVKPYQSMFKAGFQLVDDKLRIFEKSPVRKIYY